MGADTLAIIGVQARACVVCWVCSSLHTSFAFPHSIHPALSYFFFFSQNYLRIQHAQLEIRRQPAQLEVCCLF
jgi:hypothetical protein